MMADENRENDKLGLLEYYSQMNAAERKRAERERVSELKKNERAIRSIAPKIARFNSKMDDFDAKIAAEPDDGERAVLEGKQRETWFEFTSISNKWESATARRNQLELDLSALREIMEQNGETPGKYYPNANVKELADTMVIAPEPKEGESRQVSQPVETTTHETDTGAEQGAETSEAQPETIESEVESQETEETGGERQEKTEGRQKRKFWQRTPPAEKLAALKEDEALIVRQIENLNKALGETDESNISIIIDLEKQLMAAEAELKANQQAQERINRELGRKEAKKSEEQENSTERAQKEQNRRFAKAEKKYNQCLKEEQEIIRALEEARKLLSETDKSDREARIRILEQIAKLERLLVEAKEKREGAEQKMNDSRPSGEQEGRQEKKRRWWQRKSKEEPQQESGEQTEKKKGKEPENFDGRPLDEYAALLQAKTTMFKSKTQKGLVVRADEIGAAFRQHLDSLLSGKEAQAQLEAISNVSKEIAEKLNQRKGTMEKLITAFRKPGASTARLILGIGLGAVAALSTFGVITLGAVATVMFAGAGGVLGAVGRFLGTDALYDKIHLAITGRAKNGESAIAARVFRNDLKKIDKVMVKAYGATVEATQDVQEDGQEIVQDTKVKVGREISSTALDSAFQKYADNIRKNKFWKTAISTLAAVVPFGIRFFTGEHAAPPTTGGPKATAAADSTNIQADSTYVADADSTFAPGGQGTIPGAGAQAPHVSGGAGPGFNVAPGTGGASSLFPNNLTSIVDGNTYAVGRGQGIWHVAETIAEKNVPGLSDLSRIQRLQVVDAIKDAIVKNPEDFGLRSTLLHPGDQITCTIEQMKDALVAGGVKVGFPAASPVSGLGGVPDLLRTTINPDSTLFADSLRTTVFSDSLVTEQGLRTVALSDTTGLKAWTEGFKRYFNAMPDSVKVDSLGYIKKVPLKR